MSDVKVTQAMAEYREAVIRRFAQRMAQGDFVAQRSAAVIGGLPCTVKADGVKTLSHGNALVALQVLQDRGITDPRFFTLAQIEEAGWRLKENASGVLIQGVLMQYQSHGDGHAKRLRVYSTADIDGPAPWMAIRDFNALTLSHIVAEGGDIRAGLDAWVKQAGHSGSEAQLRRQILGVWLEAAGGLEGMTTPLAATEWQRLSQWVNERPERLYKAIGDAELMYADIAGQIRALQFEQKGVRDVAAKAIASGSVPSTGNDGRKDMGTGDRLTWIERQYKSRQTILGVPFNMKDRVHQLGAIWHPDHKIWFVPEGVNRALFKEWDLSGGLSNVATEGMILDSFAAAMKEAGLRLPNEIKADGEWHNVRVETKKANNAGAYMLVIDNVLTPYGRISNKLSGLREEWIYEGNLLTPEQRKRIMEQARAREELAQKEQREVQDRVAQVAEEVFSQGIDAAGHGYANRKGVSVDGLRQISGKALLQHKEFYGENGRTVIRANQMYLLVPLQNEEGQIRNLQAISTDGKTKSFMRGAQKAGLMFVLGAPNFAALQQSGCSIVAYAEGYATGFDFHQACRAPMVVTFDAGNMESVVKRTAPLLPKDTLKALAIDNDQFYVEKALSHIAEHVGVNPFSGQGGEVTVVSRYGDCALCEGARRSISLGDVQADGEWHKGPKGNYRVTIEREANSEAVRSLHVEILLPGPDKDVRLSNRFNNRGAEAGKVGMVAAENCCILAPSFSSLDGRPTDWNDLKQVEGYEGVLSQIVSQLDGYAFEEWFKGQAPVSRQQETGAAGLQAPQTALER